MFKLVTRKIKIKYNYSLPHKLMSSGADLNVKIMSNGLKVATKLVDSPLFCASLFIKCGPRYENSCNNGISHFIEHMAVSNKDIEEFVHKNCMSVTSVTTREYQMFSAVSPVEYMPQCIEVLLKIISKIDDYDETDVDANKQHICFEASDYDNNPKSVTFDYLHQTAFQGTPLAQSVIGTTKNILSFDKCLLSDFIKQTYQPQKLFLALCGNVTHTALIEQVNLHLHCLRYKNCNPVNIGTQRYTGSQIVYRDDSMPYAHITIALEVPGRHSAEYLTCLVASCLTGSWDRTQGGTITNGSPLACAASTSHLCEKFETFYIPYQDVGLWGIYFISQRLGIDNMVESIQEHWMKMCTMTVKSDVQRAVNLAKFKLAKRMTGVKNFSRDMGTQLLYSPDGKTSLDLYNELSSVTDTMIKEFGYTYIYDKCPAVAAVGPTEALLPYTRIRGGMYWLRL